MADAKSRLREIATSGSDMELKVALLGPGGAALAQDGFGMTALMRVAYDDKKEYAAIFLPACNALTRDERGRDVKGMADAVHAAFKAHKRCVEILLPISDVLAKAKDGSTALMYAVCNGHEGNVRLILQASDPLAKDADGLTALIHAVSDGHEVCVRILLPVSDALAQDRNGMTALMCAAMNGNEICTRLLLPKSDAAAKDKFGRTAVDRARSGNHENLARFIKAYDLSKGEQEDIESEVKAVVTRGKAAPRV